jgi:ACS family hexuronate transporter-like MFS transporter
MTAKPLPDAQTSNYRWVICAVLFFATTINYIDRQILSLIKPILDQELHWTNEQFGWVNSLFQGAYAISYLGFGWFIDKYGTKIGYAVSIFSWSVAVAAHAVVNTISGFGIARVALGLGEGGNFPAAIKSVAQWFPVKERAFATTLFNSGANVGALLAPALIPPIALAFSWHAPFLVAGIAGFVWLGFWWVLYRPAPALAGAASATGVSEEVSQPPLSWRKLLTYRQTWAYVGAQILISPVWWFFLIWLPDYFKQTRGMDLKAMGLPLVVIYAIVTVLSIAGVWAAKAFAGKGWSVTKTRRFSMLIFSCAVLPVAFAPQLQLWPAVIIIGIAGGAHQAWSATLFTTVSDVFPKNAVASVVGLGGFAGSLAGMIFPVVCGRVLDVFGPTGYVMLFAWCGIAYFIAFAVNALLCPRLESLDV